MNEKLRRKPSWGRGGDNYLFFCLVAWEFEAKASGPILNKNTIYCFKIILDNIK